jgi:hypothetical protein
MGFDLLAFALHHGVDIHELAEQGRLVDTMLTEVVVNPPEARTKQGQIMRALGLDALGAAKQLGGKSHDLAALAKEFGDYDQIPVDDERVRRLLRPGRQPDRPDRPHTGQDRLRPARAPRSPRSPPRSGSTASASTTTCSPSGSPRARPCAPGGCRNSRTATACR